MNSKNQHIAGAIFCLAALAAWGQGSGKLLVALCMGLLLVAASLFPYRVHATAKARSRANDLTLVIIATSSFWFYLQRQTLQTNLAIHLLSSCPMFLYPKLLFGFLQSPSTSDLGSAPPRDGALLARRWLEGEFSFSRRHMDKRRSIAYQDVYFFLALFVSSFTLPPSQGIPIAAGSALVYCVFHAWHPMRKASLSILGALLACFFCLVAAAVGSIAIQKGQEFAEDYYSQLWPHRPDSSTSANSAETSIGRRGRLDNGNRLVLRLDWPRQSNPGYLRNGVFNHTPNGTSWSSTPPSKPALDKPLLPIETGSFIVDEANPVDNTQRLAQAKISLTLSRERSSLALPIGTHELFGLPLAKLDINSMGVPTSSGAQGFARFGVTYAPGRDPQPQPASTDTEVPLALIPAIDRFLDESHARGAPAGKAAAIISAYFKSKWTYTLNLQDAYGNTRSLARFLQTDREGHCEYFASATTLALRRLGYPARYSTGYLVSEFDERENLFWVRTRDAHAWSHVWNGSAWELVDSTPAGPPEESDLAVSASDFLSRIQYMVEDFDPSALSDRVDARVISVLGILLLALLAYRLRFRKSTAAEGPTAREAIALSQAMARLTGQASLPGETAFEYWLRLAPKFKAQSDIEQLARERERALFMPVLDQEAALMACELRAKALRRRLALAPAPAPAPD